MAACLLSKNPRHQRPFHTLVFVPTLAGLLLLWLWLTSSPVAAQGEIFYVKAGAAGSGASWSDPASLQHALSTAVSGDQIWVAQGRYIPGISASDAFQLKNGVALYGGFIGIIGTEGNFNVRDWEDNLTVLSGDIENNDSFKGAGGTVTNSQGITGTNSLHVVTATGVTATAVLNGFYITAGDATSSLALPCGACGGGIALTNSSPTLADLVLLGNLGTNGGGMYNSNSNPTLANVRFSGNAATNHGGGLFNSESSPTLTDITINFNTAATNGGGIYSLDSSPILTNVTLRKNHADTSGGGMYNNDSNPHLIDVTFDENTTDGDGGGLTNASGSSPNLMDVTFAGNTAALDGGGILNANSSPTISNTLFITNSALRGGGMFNYFSTFTISGSTLMTNTADNGGGIYNAASNATVAHGMFRGNRANVSGGGMYSAESSPTITNTTFISNFANIGGGGMYSTNSSPSVTNSNFTSNHTGTNGFGGGMYNLTSHASLSKVIFQGNYTGSEGKGGGIYNGTSHPTLIGVTFRGNVARIGGGMSNILSSPTISNTTFITNAGTGGGGGMSNEFNSDPLIVNSAFLGNFAGNGGGGMVNFDDSKPRLINVIFSGNFSGRDGGGLYSVGDSSPMFTNVTFSGNHADNRGGAMLIGLGETLLHNTVVWGNTATVEAPSIDHIAGSLTIRHSLIAGGLPEGSVDGGNNLDGILNPLFVRPVSCGSDGMCSDNPATGADESADDDYGDLRLLPASPALDSGNNTALPLTVTTDLADQPRIVTVKFITPTVDMGAYEATNSAPAFATTPPLNATEDVTYTYTISVTDPNQPDSVGLNVRAISMPTWLTFTVGSNLLSGLPSNDDVGDHALSLQVQDSGGLTATQAFTLSVANTNDAPTFTSSPPLTATVGGVYSYSVATSDADVGDTRTLTVLTKPSWLTFAAANDGGALLSGNPAPADVGVGLVVLQVQDMGGLTAVQSFSVTVSATVVPTGSVVGKVTATGVGIADATVTVECDINRNEVCSAAEIALGVTDAAGNFALDNVPIGNHLLFIAPPPAYSTPAPLPITVIANQVTTIPEIALALSWSGELHLPRLSR